MAYDEKTAYATEYNHTGTTVGLGALHKTADAGGQLTNSYAVKIAWEPVTAPDYGSGSPSFSPHDSALTYWKATSGAPDPLSGDIIEEGSVDWVILSVTDNRHSSWRLTVTKAEANA